MKQHCRLIIVQYEVGGDAAHPKTKAIRKGDKFIINGTKTFITNAPNADIFVVYATINENSEKRNVSAFVVEKEFKGIKIDKIKKWGKK